MTLGLVGFTVVVVVSLDEVSVPLIGAADGGGVTVSFCEEAVVPFEASVSFDSAVPPKKLLILSPEKE